MPDFWTHTHGGNAIMDGIYDIKYKNLFNYACQGPDFLFYLNFSPLKGKRIGKALGNRIHEENVHDFLTDLFESARKTNNLLIEEYFYGALCHYVLDSNMHPLINAYKSDKYTHKDVEMAMDLVVNGYFGQKIPGDDNPRFYLDFETNLSKINDWYFKSVKNIFNKSVSDNWIQMAHKDFMDFHIIFSDMNPVKAWLLKFIHNFIPVKSYIYPDRVDPLLFTEERHKDIKKALDTAISEGKEAIKKARHGFENPTEPIDLFSHMRPLDYSGIPF